MDAKERGGDSRREGAAGCFSGIDWSSLLYGSAHAGDRHCLDGCRKTLTRGGGRGGEGRHFRVPNFSPILLYTMEWIVRQRNVARETVDGVCLDRSSCPWCWTE